MNGFCVCVCVCVTLLLQTLKEYLLCVRHCSGFPGSTVVKNLPASAEDERDAGSVHGSGRCSREGNGNLI